MGQIVQKSSAVIPGVNVEAIPIYKDHSTIVKFKSAEDKDFKTVYQHLQGMVSKAPWTVAERWKLHRKYKSK
jgi:hypothetical protein